VDQWNPLAIGLSSVGLLISDFDRDAVSLIRDIPYAGDIIGYTQPC